MSVLVVMRIVYYNPKGYSMIWSDIIDISWSDRKLQKSCSSDKDGKRTFGADQWKVLKNGDRLAGGGADARGHARGSPGAFTSCRQTAPGSSRSTCAARTA